MPFKTIKLVIPSEIAENVERETLQSGFSRQKVIVGIIDKHFSQLPVAIEDQEKGFDSIMERQYLKFRLEEAGLRYQKLFREHEELKATFEITIKKITMPWWIRLKNKMWKKEGRLNL